MENNCLTYQYDSKEYKVKSSIRLEIKKGTEITFYMQGQGAIYGYGFTNEQYYPWNEYSLQNDNFEVNNTQSPVWLLEAGIVIFANTTESLSVVMNKEELKLCCGTKDLIILVYVDKNLTLAQKQFMSYFEEFRRTPMDGWIEDSVFCTWTQHPRSINEEKIIAFAKQIRENDYPCSVLVMDDKWEHCYGDFSFSKDFPNPKAMVEELHTLGYQVILWITPFINVDSTGFSELSAKRLLVWNEETDTPATFRWWGGCAGLIDLTKPEGRQWYKEKLLYLKEEYRVDGFKIDGGDAKYQPDSKESTWYDFKGASGFSDILLSVFEEVAPGKCETRTTWISQERNMIWREGGKDSHWGKNNGLKALVNQALHMSVMGYDLIMPDMVGGRVQTMSETDPLVTDELFIRFTEASAFMPSLQFSYFPWNYCKEVNEVVRTYARIHKKIGYYVKELMKENKTLLIRPMWYENDEQKELFYVADQYMLGPDMVVAPILESNMKTRTVILPKGEWKDIYTGEVVGQGSIKVEVKCPKIPVYIRATNEELYAVIHNEIVNMKTGFVKSNVTTATYQAGINRDIRVTG